MPSRDLQLRVFGKDMSAGRTLDGIAQKAQHTGRKLAGSLGMKIGIAGVAAALTGIASIGIAYEDSLNTFQAVSGATTAEMSQVSEAAKQLGNDLSLPSTSAAGAALAMTELAKAGLSVKQSMDAAKGTLALAAAAAVDEATAAQMVGTALNAFSLQGSQATRVADLLAGASNAASGEMTDMSAALQQAGTVSAAAGLSIDDTVAAISMLAQKGILGSDAGTSLKTMLMKLQGPSDKAAGALKDLGINAYDANGQMLPLRDLIQVFTEKTQALTQAERDKANATIFGTDATRAALSILEGGVDTFDDMHAAVTKQGAVFDTAAAKSKGLGGAVRGLQSTVETLAIAFYEKVAPGATTVVETLTKLLGAVEPLIGVLIDLNFAGFHVVNWLREHEVVAGVLAAAITTYLAPALLLAITRFKTMIALNLAAMFLTAKGGVIGLTTAVRGLSIATIAATAGVSLIAAVLVAKLTGAKEGAEQAKVALDEMWDGVQMGDDQAVGRATKSTRELGEAAKTASFGGVRSLGDAWDYYSGKIDKKRGAEEQAARTLEEQTAAHERAKTAVGHLSSALGINEQAVLKLATRAGVDLADGTGAATKAVKDLYFASVNGTPASQDLAGAMAVIADESADATDKVDALKTALDAVFGIAMNVSEATDSYEAALDSLTESVKQNGTSLDGTTEKGRANRDAVRASWQATLDLTKALADNGAGAEVQRKTLEDGLGALKETARRAGLSADQVDRLAAELNATPKAISTAVKLTGIEAAMTTFDKFRRSVRAFTSGTHTVRVKGDFVTGGTRIAGAKADGGRVLSSGAYLVGEEGPEIVDLRAGSNVLTAAQTAAALTRPANSASALSSSGGGGGSRGGGTLLLEVPVQLDGRELARGTARFTLAELRRMTGNGTDLEL